MVSFSSNDKVSPASRRMSNHHPNHHHHHQQQQQQQQQQLPHTPLPFHNKVRSISRSNSNNKYGPSYGTPSSTPVERRTKATGGFMSPTVHSPQPHGLGRYGPQQQRQQQHQQQHQQHQQRPYASMEVTPFMNRRRKKGDSVAKWTARAVLLSPLMVLVCWSCVLVLSSKSQLEQVQQQQPHQLGVSKQTAEQIKQTAKQIKKSRHSNNNKNTNGKKKHAKLKARMKAGTLATEPAGAVHVLVQPIGEPKATTNETPALAETSKEHPMTTTSSTDATTTTSDIAIVPPAATAATVLEPTLEALTGTAKGESVQLTPSVSLTTPKQQQQQEEPEPEPPLSKSNTKIYYYDASKSMQSGSLTVPEIVYDANGTPIQLETLNNGKTEIYLEPPTLQQEQPKVELPAPAAALAVDPIPLGTPMVVAMEPSTTTTATEPLLEAKSAKMISLQNLYNSNNNNESNSSSNSGPPPSDQMIIVSTVAVMALLVGALSARRMRSRNFLAVCIENESLEDELAYDTAYTSSPNSNQQQGGGNGAYDTFSNFHGAPWKGDLEKFDV